MALIGKDTKIEVSTAKGGTYYEIDGIRDCTFSPKREQHETTDFKSASAGSGDYDEVKTFEAGLKESTGSISGDYEPGDTNGQVAITTAADAGTSMWFKFLWDGVNGDQVEALIDREVSGAVDGKMQVTFNLQAISTWIAV